MNDFSGGTMKIFKILPFLVMLLLMTLPGCEIMDLFNGEDDDDYCTVTINATCSSGDGHELYAVLTLPGASSSSSNWLFSYTTPFSGTMAILKDSVKKDIYTVWIFVDLDDNAELSTNDQYVTTTYSIKEDKTLNISNWMTY